MRTQVRSRSGWAAAGALAFVVGAPTLAQAQQSGLFPLAPIRRERMPCQMEDPVYKLYRHEYFGYHPTCWRRFPAGWGCPSPEAPNPAASFRELPREAPPADTAEGAPGSETPGPGEAMPAPGEGNTAPRQNNLPPLPPSDRSPFDLDNRPSSPPPGNPPEDRRAPAPENAGSPGLGLQETPPVAEPPSTLPLPGASNTGARGDEPLLALPDPTVNVPAPSPTPAQGNANLNVNPNNNTGPQAFAPTPAQAPRRQSLLSNLFGNLRRR